MDGTAPSPAHRKSSSMLVPAHLWRAGTTMFEIGTTLLEARARQQLDIPSCEAGTKIRAKYLRAMEEEQFDVLPSPTYVRGFLKTYGDFLGVDGQLLVDEYESRNAQPARLTRDIRTTPSRRASSPRARNGKRGKAAKRRTEGQLLWLALGGVMGIALLVWLGAGKASTPAPQISNGLPPGPVTPTTQDPHLATPEVSQPIKVQLIGTGPYGSYVDVRQDSATGTQLFTGLISPTGSETFSTMSSIWLLSANPTGLRVVVDGKTRVLPASTTTFVITKNGPQPAPHS